MEMELSSMFAAESGVRVVALGPARGPAHAAAAPARPPAWLKNTTHRAEWPWIARRLRQLARHDTCDVVHLTDARLAPLGRWLRRRLDVAVSVDVSPYHLAASGGRAERLFAALDTLDAAFVFGAAGEDALRARTSRVPVARLPLVALPSEPSPSALTAVGRLLAHVEPGRPVIAVPWTADAGEWSMFRDVLLPAFGARPLWLISGVTGARAVAEARRSLSGTAPVVFDTTPLEDPAIAALARYADAFVVPWSIGNRAPEADALLRLALAASGIPVIAADGGTPVLEHERNAFLVRKGDAAGFSATLDQLFGLPARQRQYIGEEFASDAMARWPAAAAVDVYEERFAELAGRTSIPIELRVA